MYLSVFLGALRLRQSASVGGVGVGIGAADTLIKKHVCF